MLTSAAEHAKKYTRKLILNNELRPGTHVTEEEIAKQLKISRPPIRESFKTLEENGLLERKARRGVFVTEISEKDLHECFMVRMVLYGLAIRVCIDKITNRGILKLDKIVEQMKICANNDEPDIDRYQDLNCLFHNTIIEIAEYGRLKKFCANLDDQIRRYSYFSLKSKKNLLTSQYEYHRGILDAIIEKDPVKALKLNEDHIRLGLENALISFSTRHLS